jgi:putative hemolysin
VESNGVLELAGSLSLVDVRSDHRLEIPEGDWNTLGGYVFGQLGRLARIGDRVAFPGGELEVVAMDGRRVAAVRVLKPRANVALQDAAPALADRPVEAPAKRKRRASAGARSGSNKDVLL